MIIRTELVSDHNVIRKIHHAAFDGPGEARLVELLRKDADPIISLVAEDENGEVIGHIMFSLIKFSGHEAVTIMGLAPVAIIPDKQNNGFGSALINAGIEECRKRKFEGVVLLGHADYYPRFGFKTSTDYAITCEYDVPAANFMALELNKGAFDSLSGQVKYHPAFAEL